MNNPAARIIREKRIELGYTQKEFAAKIGLPYGRYREYENESRKLFEFDAMKKIADEFGMSLDYLYGRTRISHTADYVAENPSQFGEGDNSERHADSEKRDESVKYPRIKRKK